MWQYNYTSEPDELYHHGIRGMKWGQRRYQNKDGSLTAAGKKRYNTDAERNLAEKKEAFKAANKAYNKSFSKAYDRSIAAWSPSKKHRQANDERWADAQKKLDEYHRTKDEYKAAKADVKKARNQDLKRLERNARYRGDWRESKVLNATMDKGATYGQNITAGALGGMALGMALNLRNSRTGKMAVTNLLVGTGLGVIGGTATATTNIVKGNLAAKKRNKT